ncbi:MAG: sulfatase-like hydrolase/transferase [Chthoniobacter sp.]
MPGNQGFDFAFAGHANTTPSATEGGKGEYELTAAAEKWIEENKDHPFFLYLAHNCPHVPLAAKPELIEKHKDAWNPFYAAMMETLDDSVGRVIAKVVDALGLAERTIFIFTSDNGGLHVAELPNTPATYNAPFRAGKGYLEEGGLREPLIVRWPGKIKAGVTNETPVMLYDFMPTLMTAAGLDVAHTVGPLDGVNILPLLTGGTLPPRTLYWHFPNYTNQGSKPAGAVRDGEWKLIQTMKPETSSCTTSWPIRGRRAISRRASRRRCPSCRGNWRRGGRRSAHRWERRTRISMPLITGDSMKTSIRRAWSPGRVPRNCARSCWPGAMAWTPRSKATSRGSRRRAGDISALCPGRHGARGNGTLRAAPLQEHDRVLDEAGGLGELGFRSREGGQV